MRANTDRTHVAFLKPPTDEHNAPTFRKVKGFASCSQLALPITFVSEASEVVVVIIYPREIGGTGG